MKFVAFNGSPSGKASATGRIIEAFLAGAHRAGAEADCYHLCEYNIAQCRGCFFCWFRSPGRCVLQDDMPELLHAYQTADVVCFGSPVYSWNMTALLKNFVDRLVPLKNPLLTQQNGHFDMVDTAAAVDHAARMTQDTDNLLQLAHLAIFQLGGIEFDSVCRCFAGAKVSVIASFQKNTAVTDDFPLLAVTVNAVVGIVAAVMVVAGMKMFCQHLRGFLAAQSGHLNFTAKILVTEIKGQAVHLAVLHP